MVMVMVMAMMRRRMAIMMMMVMVMVMAMVMVMMMKLCLARDPRSRLEQSLTALMMLSPSRVCHMFVICNPTLVTEPDFAMLARAPRRSASAEAKFCNTKLRTAKAGARDSSDAALHPAHLRQRIFQ